jgi:hypothetical protein
MLTTPVILSPVACFHGPPLWSRCQSSWLQIQKSGFDSRNYQIFWKVVGLERGPLSLVITVEELLERKSSGSDLESREYGRRDPSRLPRCTLQPQELALTSPTSGSRLVAIVRSRTQATEVLLEAWFPSELICKYGLFKRLVGLFGRETSPVARPLSAQDKQTQEKRRHACLEWDSNTRFKCLAGEDVSCLRQDSRCEGHSVYDD